MLRIVLLQHAARVGGQGLVAQLRVGLGQYRDRVVLVFALRIGLQQLPCACGRRNPRVSAQVIQRAVQLVAREQIA